MVGALGCRRKGCRINPLHGGRIFDGGENARDPCTACYHRTSNNPRLSKFPECSTTVCLIIILWFCHVKPQQEIIAERLSTFKCLGVSFSSDLSGEKKCMNTITSKASKTLCFIQSNIFSVNSAIRLSELYCSRVEYALVI